MTAPLEGLSVVEGTAFVAAPSGGMTLAQLGADVIRFDQVGGGLDHRRWPLTAEGVSLYWNGLNRGKRSLAVNLRDPEVTELLSELIARAGNFLTNFPAVGWMSYDELRSRRQDLVMLVITGSHDGTSALDYTESAASQISDLAIGTADELIWDKTFKIRLTSKKTGKKIDLNITYNLNSV